MKKQLTRTISLFLCLAMVFCVPAFAVEEEMDAHDGHDCAEHEMEALTYEVLSYDNGISVAPAAVCSHNYVVVDEGPSSKSDSHALFPSTPSNPSDGLTVYCSYTNYYYNYQWVCQKCGHANVESIFLSSTHAIPHN